MLSAATESPEAAKNDNMSAAEAASPTFVKTSSRNEPLSMAAAAGERVVRECSTGAERPAAAPTPRLEAKGQMCIEAFRDREPPSCAVPTTFSEAIEW